MQRINMEDTNNNIERELETFIKMAKILVEDEQANPVSELIPSEELFEKMDLSLGEKPLDEEQFQASLQELVLKTPKTASKNFFNQLFGGRQSKAVLGDLLAVMLNNSMYTYKVGGPQIGVEKEIIKQICDRVGYSEKGGGTFAAGGSMCNYMGLVMGRDYFDARIKNEGVRENLVAYTSKESHYSNAKNAAFAGIGRNNIRYVATNDRGEMSLNDLKQAIEEDLNKGNKPFFVNATVGTTVLGMSDPIDEIADLCKEYGLWLHVDGAYGGAAIFSRKHGAIFKGIEKSDSFCLNAHKMLGTPLSCSILVVKDKSNLDFSFSNDADYLYQTHDDDFNPGKTSFQCGRRNDALKFWTLWKSIGSDGLEKMVDHEYELAAYAREYVANHPDYTLYGSPNTIAICFNYKDIDPKTLCTALFEQRELVVGYGEFRGQEFVRLVTVNATNSKEDLRNFFSTLEAFVENNMSLFKQMQHQSI